MTPQQIKARLANGQEQFQQINETLQAINEKLDKVEADMQSTKEIVEAWNAVKTGGKFIRWALPILAGIGSFWLAIKGWVFK